MNQLLLDGCEEALSNSIVPTVTLATHAAFYATSGQRIAIVLGRVVATPV